MKRTMANWAAMIVVLLTCVPAMAATITWDGDTDTDWLNDANWVGGAKPGTTSTAAFDSTVTPYQPTLNGAASIDILSFTQRTDSTGWTLGGTGTLTLATSASAADPAIQVNSGSHTINANLALSTAYINLATAGSMLTINGTMSGGSINATGSGILRVNGLMNSRFYGRGGMVVFGSDDSWARSEASVFYLFASTTVAAAGDRVFSSGVYGGSNTFTFGDSTGTYNGNITLLGNGGGSGGYVKTSSNTLTVTRTMGGSSGWSVNNGTLKLLNVIDQPFGGVGSASALTITGGTLDLGGSSTATFGYTASGGTITNTNSARTSIFEVPSTSGGVISTLYTGNLSHWWAPSSSSSLEGGDYTFTGDLRLGAKSYTLTFRNAGRLTNANSVIVAGSRLGVDNSGTVLTDRIADGIPITLAGGGLVFTGKTGVDVTETLGTINLPVGHNRLSLTTPTTSGTQTVTIGAINRSAGGGLVMDLQTRTAVKSSVALTPVNSMLAPWLISDTDAGGTGATFLTYDNTLGFRPIASYDKTSLVGTGFTDKVDLSAGGSMSGSVNVYALRTSGSITGSGTLTIASGGLIMAASSDTNIAPDLRFADASDNAVEAIIYTGNNNTRTRTIQGNIVTSAGLTKIGKSTLKLMNPATGNWSGLTSVNSGQLTFNTTSAIYVPDDLTVSSSKAGETGSGFDAEVLFTADNQIASDSVVTVRSNAKLNVAGTSQSIGGLNIIADANSVANVVVSKATGGGRLTLNGDVHSEFYYPNYNVYTPQISSGNTSGALGELDLNGVRTFDTNIAWYVNMAALDVYTTVINTAAGSKGLIKTGNGILQFRVANTFAGPITVSGGLLRGLAAASGSPFGDTGNAVSMLESGGLSLMGLSTASTTTAVGNATFSGVNPIELSNANTTYYVLLQMNALTRAGRGTLIAKTNGLSVVDSYNRFAVTSGAPANDGAIAMTDAYYFHQFNGPLDTQVTFAKWDATYGFRPVTYSAKTDLNLAVATDIFDSNETQVLTADRSVYALRTYNRNVSGPYTLTIAGHSTDNNAGLIFNGDITVSSNLKFGAAGAAEGIVFANINRAPTISGQVLTTGGLTKTGLGTLVLSADNSATLSGGTWIVGGTLRAGHAKALGVGDVVIQAGTTLDIGGNFTFENDVFKGVGQVTTGSYVFTVGASSKVAPGMSIGTLTVEDLDFRGTYDWEFNETANDLIVAQTLAFGSGAATLNVLWTGSGDAPTGTWTLMTYAGADPTNATWTVNAPSGLVGLVTVDGANDRVLLTLSTESVPEPATLVLLAVGGLTLGAGAVRRHRRRS
ncbi:MAG: hypothetical protein BIFFINMI_02284 [Phycisphaerae bacterium]|nr:hypothetical protein [Phycisphaerae bacterium]